MNIKRHYRPEKVKKYEARWYVEGRLKCRFFATEKERERFIEEFQEQLSQNGASLLLGFDPTKMRRWQEASRLAPDADPVEVMQFWLASNRPNLKPKAFDEAIPSYIEYLEALRIRQCNDLLFHKSRSREITQGLISKNQTAILRTCGIMCESTTCTSSASSVHTETVEPLMVINSTS